MRITSYQQRVTPEFSIHRGESGLSLDFFYGLEGYYDEELGYYTWAGEISATLGEFGGYHYESNDGPMFMSFGADLDYGVTYEGHYDLSDYNDGTYVTLDFTVTTYDAAGDFSGGEAADFVFGSSEGDALDGAGGDDIFDGFGGKDTMAGGEGDDRLNGGGNRDLLDGGVGDDDLYGGVGRDVLKGGDGDDKLSGKGGADKMEGGAGADVFVFRGVLAEGQADAILDFVHGEDHIQLTRQMFGALTGDALGEEQFLVNKTGVAETAEQRIVYNKKTGELFYDADGSGEGQAILFASLQKGARLDVDDFLVTA